MGLRKAETFYLHATITMLGAVMVFGCATTQKQPEQPLPPDNFTRLERIIRHPSDDLFPEASSDGKYVAYASKKGDNFDVFYFDPSQPRTTVIQATRHVSHDYDPDWSPDGLDLFFTSSRLPTLSVWKVKVAGSRGVNQITVREDAHDFNPNVSPKGAKIVFASRGEKDKPKMPLEKRDKGKKDPSLWIANIDGSRLTMISSGNNPKWSPDGKKILFHALAGDNYDVWMINPDGTDLTQITTDSADDLDAAWSPDGKMIVFSSNREGTINVKTNFDLWALDLEGTGITQLTFDPADDGAPFWSVDKYIYFHSNRKGNYDIYRGKPIITW